MLVPVSRYLRHYVTYVTVCGHGSWQRCCAAVVVWCCGGVVRCTVGAGATLHSLCTTAGARPGRYILTYTQSTVGAQQCCTQHCPPAAEETRRDFSNVLCTVTAPQLSLPGPSSQVSRLNTFNIHPQAVVVYCILVSRAAPCIITF